MGVFPLELDGGGTIALVIGRIAQNQIEIRIGSLEKQMVHEIGIYSSDASLRDSIFVNHLFLDNGNVDFIYFLLSIRAGSSDSHSFWVPIFAPWFLRVGK